MSDIKNWIDLNCLKMNCSKTEFIMIGGRQQVAKTNTKEVKINGEMIQSSDCVKYLGVYDDKTLSLKTHVREKCKTAMYNLL